LSLPSTQAISHEADIQAEGVADVDERVGPVGVVRLDPLLDFGEQPLPGTVSGPDVLLEGADRVLHDREHETLLRLEGGIEARPDVKLRGQYHFWLKLHTHPW